MNLQQAKTKLRAPGATLVLPLWVFADEWEHKPNAPVCVGLRLLSETDKSQARAEASRLATQLHPEGGDNWVDAFNDQLQLAVSAVGMCDPNDVRKPPELFPVAVDQVPNAFTSKGAGYVFQAIARYEVQASPIEVPAGAEEIARLLALLGKVDPETLSLGLRRTISYVAELLEPFAGELVDAGAVDDAADKLPLVVSKELGIGDALRAR